MKLLLATIFFALSTGAAYCDTYSWEDQNGINFTDDLGKVPKKYRSKAMAEVRADRAEGISHVTESVPSRNSQSDPRQPKQKNQLNESNVPERNNPQQEQPQNIQNADDGGGYQDNYDVREGYGNHRQYYDGQSRGVRRAQRSAYESQTPARKAMNQAEEMIRQSRQALDSGVIYPTKQKYQHKGGRNHNYNRNERNR